MEVFGMGGPSVDLAAILADPKAAKARLEQLSAAQTELQKASDDARDALADLRSKENELAAREEVVAAQLREIRTAQSEIMRQTDALRMSQGFLADAQAAYNVDKSTLTAQTIEFHEMQQAQSADLGSREANVSVREAIVAAKEAELNERAKKLRDALA